MATLETIQSTNMDTLAYVQSYRAKYRTGTPDFARFSREKHQHSYFGFVDCRACEIDFVIFHANDDIVAWEYLWFGNDAYEKEIVPTWVRWSKVAKCILDIGGYTGVMSVLGALANPIAEIHLFEPMDRTIERAKINVRANGVDSRVHLHNKAASSENKLETINLYRNEDFLGTGNSLYDKGLEIKDRKIIETVRLDDYLPTVNPDLVKIDVEGHELDCLLGMSNMLERSRPRVLIEIWEHQRADVLSLLGALSYECAPIEKREQRVMNFWCVPT